MSYTSAFIKLAERRYWQRLRARQQQEEAENYGKFLDTMPHTVEEKAPEPSPSKPLNIKK